MAKHKKPFTDCDLFKEAMAVATETALHGVLLGPATVKTIDSMSEDLDQQVFKGLSH